MADEKGQRFCFNHKKQFNVFCETCNECICEICIDDHKGHSFTSVKNKADSTITIIKDFETKAKDVTIPDIQKRIKTADEEREEGIKAIDQCIEDAEEHRKTLKRKIDSYANDMVAKLRKRKRDRYTDPFKSFKKKSDEHIKTLKDKIKETKNVTPNKPIWNIDMGKDLASVEKEEIATIDKLPEITFNKGKNWEKDLEKVFGKINEGSVPKKSTKQLVSNENDNQTCSTSSSFQGSSDRGEVEWSICSISPPSSTFSNHTNSKKVVQSTYASTTSMPIFDIMSKNRSHWRTLIVNCQSIKNKSDKLRSVISQIKPDVVIGCESWLDNSIINSEVFPEGYNAYRKDRNINGGGVFILIKDHYNSKLMSLPEFECELLWITVKVKNSVIRIGSFYRPPNTSSDVINELDASICMIKDDNPIHIIIGGDFNLPGINWDYGYVNRRSTNGRIHEELLNTISKHSLENIIETPTRKSNLLDLYLTNDSSLVKYKETLPGIADHDMVVVDADIRK